MVKIFNNLIFLVKSRWRIIIVTLSAFSLRFINLGYSDYQGDEIKSFFILDDGQSVSDFLLNQRKGPGQFLITLLVKQFNPGYENELITRFLFALAGSLAVIFFYKLIDDNYGKKIALYSSLFFATNGFFVALSRISQYQSFVILFMVLAIYSASKAVMYESTRKKGIFLAYIFWALAILFHYDGVFIAPVMFYLTVLWIKKEPEAKAFLLKTLVISGILLSLFYIPFVINISQNTLAYWSGRLSGDVSAKLSSSRYLFAVYQPIYVVHFYTALFLSGIFYISTIVFRKIRLNKRIVDLVPVFDHKIAFTFFIVLWFTVSLAFFEGLVYIPGTHIYNYLLPMFIIMALGVVFVEKILEKFRKIFIPSVISYTGLFVLFTFLYLQSYAIFVDHTKEYPWEQEDFLIWEFPKPTPIFHLSMFGFPYYRNWEGISNVILGSDNNGFYSTNERKSIVRFYVPFKKSTDKAGHFIHILNPQSFTNEIQQEKARYWADNYPPIFTFSKSGKDLVRVYYMEPGELDEIIEKGF